MSPQAPSDAVRFGKYDLLATLGRGGTAEIFLARVRGKAGVLVIKRVLPHLTGEVRFVQMLLEEAKVASLLAHPGIVRILELGQEEGQVYLAMEYVPGWNLQSIAMAAGGRVPPRIAARIGQSVAAALGHAHRRTDLEGKPLRMVHRDVTPCNVMVTPAGEVKLIDFGIAKAATQLAKTAPGVLKGKLRFMSPEQVRKQPADPRSDQFSLGVCLYEITTGSQPFGRPQPAETLEAIRDFEPPRPRLLVPDYPPEIEEVILRSLEKAPEDRYPDAEEMAAALSNALGDGPGPDLAGWLRDLAARFPLALPAPHQATGEARPPASGAPDSRTSAQTVPLPLPSRADRPDLAQTMPLPMLADGSEPGVNVHEVFGRRPGTGEVTASAGAADLPTLDTSAEPTDKQHQRLPREPRSDRNERNDRRSPTPPTDREPRGLGSSIVTASATAPRRRVPGWVLGFALGFLGVVVTGLAVVLAWRLLGGP